MKNQDPLTLAALNIAIAADRLRYFASHRFTAENSAALSEFWADGATVETCRQKIGAITAYLETHPEHAQKFSSTADGNGLAGSDYIAHAAELLERV